MLFHPCESYIVSIFHFHACLYNCLPNLLLLQFTRLCDPLHLPFTSDEVVRQLKDELRAVVKSELSHEVKEVWISAVRDEVSADSGQSRFLLVLTYDMAYTTLRCPQSLTYFPWMGHFPLSQPSRFVPS